MIHVMLPEQYLHKGGQARVGPQKRLMLAVLQTAVDDCEAAGPAGQADERAHQQATAYVLSTDRSWPYSFENLCEAVGLDAGSLRRGLSGRMRQRSA